MDDLQRTQAHELIEQFDTAGRRLIRDNEPLKNHSSPHS